jgi:hypothetical protein
MTDPMAGRGMTGYGRSPTPARRTEPANLADILERVLDKGIVIAGDIQVNLLDIELLTIKLRLVIASVDRAKEMGIDWWEHDPTLSSGHSSGHRQMVEENRRLRERIAALEAGAEEEVPSAERPERRAVSRPYASESDTSESHMSESYMSEGDTERRGRSRRNRPDVPDISDEDVEYRERSRRTWPDTAESGAPEDSARRAESRRSRLDTSKEDRRG